jgi:hypothetical protein
VKEFSGSLWPTVSCKYDLGAQHRKWQKAYIQNAVIDTLNGTPLFWFCGGPDSIVYNPMLAMRGNITLKTSKGRAFASPGGGFLTVLASDTITLPVAVDTTRYHVIISNREVSFNSAFFCGWYSTSAFMVGYSPSAFMVGVDHTTKQANVYYDWLCIRN